MSDQDDDETGAAVLVGPIFDWKPGLSVVRLAFRSTAGQMYFVLLDAEEARFIAGSLERAAGQVKEWKPSHAGVRQVQ